MVHRFFGNYWVSGVSDFVWNFNRLLISLKNPDGLQTFLSPLRLPIPPPRPP
jgi:hypothetical protein